MFNFFSLHCPDLIPDPICTILCVFTLFILSVDALVNPALRSIPAVNREAPEPDARPLFLSLSIILRPLIFLTYT